MGSVTETARFRPSERPIRVFIGGTYEDLKDYRQLATDVCNAFGYLPIVMDHFGPIDKTAVRASLDKLRESDLYVGIFAYRYGYIPEGSELSIVEQEFRYAAQLRIARLCFVHDPTRDWAPAKMDSDTTRIKNFKAALETEVVRVLFTTPDNFRAELTRALAKRMQSGVDAAFEALSTFIERPEVRKTIAAFREVLVEIIRSFQVLTWEKERHDALHEIGLLCDLIASEQIQLRPDSWKNFGEVDASFGGFLDRLSLVPEPTLPQQAWIDRLRRSRPHFQTAIQEQDPDLLRNTWKGIRQEVEPQLSVINNVLTARTASIPLKQIIGAFDTVSEQLAGSYLERTVATFEGGLRELAALAFRLRTLVEKHDCWQQIDTYLKLALGTTTDKEAPDLAPCWRPLSCLVESVTKTGASDRRLAQFLDAHHALEAAIQASDFAAVSSRLRDYSSLAILLFLAADNELKDFNDELLQVAVPLARILQSLDES